MTSTISAPQIRDVDAAFGKEVLGFDLSDANANDCDWIREAVAEHAVLVFRKQDLNPRDIAAFARKLGEPRPHILLEYRVKGHPEVSMVTNVNAEGAVDAFGVSRAAAWHSDMTYRRQLPLLAMLHSVEVPSRKGGTIFADMRAAYDALPPEEKNRLDRLTAVHGDATGPAGYRRHKNEFEPAHEEGESDARHPAIRVHPSSGRRILFVNPMHTVGFVGMHDAEAVPLIEKLARHSTQAQFLYYHLWKVGDVVIWDEASTMHRNAGDYDPSERRIFMRSIVF